MSKPLFDNVGQDIKAYANGMYLTTMLGYIISALGICALFFALLEDLVALGIIIAIGLVIVGHMKAKLSVMKLYACGELVDRVMNIEKNICSSKSKNGKHVIPVPCDDSPIKPDILDLPITDRNSDGTWNCMFCDFRNSADARYCKKCDALARFK